MNLNHSKNRRWICLLLSTCLFIESGYAATGLNQGMIDTAKTFFNKTGMGKTQTVGEWFTKVKANIPAEYLKQLEPWAKENKNKTLPSFVVQIKNTTQLGKHIAISFTLDGKKSEWTIKQDTKGIALSNGIAIAHQNELEKMTLIQTNRQPKPMTFKEFKEHALKSPEWGIKYYRNLRQLSIDMENYQTLFIGKKTKKSAFNFKHNLFIESAYAQAEKVKKAKDTELLTDRDGNETEVKTCPAGAWGATYNYEKGYCEKTDDKFKGNPLNFPITAEYKCPPSEQGLPQMDCNPMVFGYDKEATPENKLRICVELKPKENFSRKCDEEAGPINSAADLSAMLSSVDKIAGTNDGDMYNYLHDYINIFRGWCLDDDEQKDNQKFPFLGKDNQSYTADDFKTKFREEWKGDEEGQKDKGVKDSNFHSREACAVMFNRLKFLEPRPRSPSTINEEQDCVEKDKIKSDKSGSSISESFETDKICKTPSLADQFIKKDKEDSASNRFCRSGNHTAAGSDHIAPDCAFGAGLVVGAGVAMFGCWAAGCLKKKKSKTKVITNTVVKEVPGTTITKEVIKEVQGATIIKEVPGPTIYKDREVIKYIERPLPEGSEDVNPSDPNRPGPGGD